MQRIRWRCSFVISRHHRTETVKPPLFCCFFCVVGYPPNWGKRPRYIDRPVTDLFTVTVWTKFRAFIFQLYNFYSEKEREREENTPNHPFQVSLPPYQFSRMSILPNLALLVFRKVLPSSMILLPHHGVIIFDVCGVYHNCHNSGILFSDYVLWVFIM